MVKVNLYTLYRTIAGTRFVMLDVEEGSSLHDCLHQLFNLHPKLEAEFIETRGEFAGEIKEHVSIFVSGEDVRSLDNLDTLLAKHDVIDIMPPVEGG